jgi:hypothetical protein
MVEPYAAVLQRNYDASLDVLARRGGISVYELLLLMPSVGGREPGRHRSHVLDLTLTQAMGELSRARLDWQTKREADAEAAMLAMAEPEQA